MNTLGKRLKYLRTSLKLTQENISDKTNISRSNISRIEKNEIKPSSDIILQLCTFFNVSTDWLLKAEGEPSPQNQPITPITTTETPETIMLLKIYNSLDEKKQHLELQKVLEVANSKD